MSWPDESELDEINDILSKLKRIFCIRIHKIRNIFLRIYYKKKLMPGWPSQSELYENKAGPQKSRAYPNKYI